MAVDRRRKNTRAGGLSNLLEQAGNVARDAARTVICFPWWLGSQLPVPGPNLSRALYGAFCEQPPPPELGPPVPPFTGGQCRTLYRVFWSFSGVGGGESFSASGDDIALGPVLGIVTEFSSPGSQSGVIITGEGRVVVAGGALPTGQQWDQSQTSYSIDQVVRLDGQPDDCGDPPPTGPVLPPGYPPAPPPGYPTVPLPPETRPVTDDDGEPGGDFIFSPTVGPIYVDVDGSIKIPVRVDIDGPLFEFAPSVDIDIGLPDFSPTINIGSGGDEPGPPDAPCCEPKPEEDEPPEEEEDEPPPSRKIIGAIVECTTGEGLKATEIFSENGPSVYAPRLGVVNFLVGLGDKQVWTQDVSVKVLSSYTPAPEGVRVIRAVFTPVPGVSGTLTTVSVRTNFREREEVEV